MTEFAFGAYRIRVDVEATRAYYAAHPLPWITCDCAGCRNFVQAVKGLAPAVGDFFSALGLDPEKPGELSWHEGTPDSISGGGCYHLGGTMVEGASKPGDYEVFLAGWHEAAPVYSVGFKPDCDLLPDDFPRPCFQMETDHRLPWVLHEPNPY